MFNLKDSITINIIISVLLALHDGSDLVLIENLRAKFHDRLINVLIFVDLLNLFLDYVVVCFLDQVTKIVYVFGQSVLMVLQLNQVKLKNPQLEIILVKLDVFGYGDTTKPLLHGGYQAVFIASN